METKTVFPVFGELHADDSPALIPSQEPARKVYENTAKLFIAPKGQPSQPAEPENGEPEVLELTGDSRGDAETAMRAIAFLIDFIQTVGAEELRRCADAIHTIRSGGKHE